MAKSLIRSLFLGALMFVAYQRVQAEDLGLRVAPGFRVSLYADHELANDIFAMTLDGHGRVVVTGPGYIKILHDSKGTGKADKATTFATPAQGGMGMCFDGNDLYFCGGGWVSRYRDRDGKGKADGPPERLLPLAYGEHGGHAIRKGPDGWWYVIGGNNSNFDWHHQTRAHSPIRNPEGGGLLRLSPDWKECEVIAQGFRNPYDFDFNEAGDIFTYDSDCERDFLLPWYTPTRIYHIAHAGHHGWRLPGHLRSWCRKDYYIDTVDMLWPVGRGSPTGVAVYRHEHFPEHYRGGLFALDWTFGKVYFFPLEPEGASYRTQQEVFLEAVGNSGFDPTDIVVAPDGSLFICMGGRGTRGAVYHVEYTGDGSSRSQSNSARTSDLEKVLYAQQPLDAWSRRQWEPLAKKLGLQIFQSAILDESLEAGARVRAVEILTELFGGLSSGVAARAAHDSSPLVRSRVAWSLGRQPCPNLEQVLFSLMSDSHARVRRAALEAIADQAYQVRNRGVLETRLEESALDVQHKRVSLAAARLATQFELPQSKSVFRVERALKDLQAPHDPDCQLRAIRLIMLELGDFCLNDPKVEIYTAYSVAGSVQKLHDHLGEVRHSVRSIIPSGDARLDEEASRLLAILEDDDPSLPAKIASFWTRSSSPTQDFHYLIVLSRLRGALSPAVIKQVAHALANLDRKLEGRQFRTKQTWNDRLAELVQQLVTREPRLAMALLQQPAFFRPGQETIAANLDSAHRRLAAEGFLKAASKDRDFPFSGQLIDLIAELPPAQVRPILRGQWSNYGLRDGILPHLARDPEANDRDRFLTGLESMQPPVVKLCLEALETLPHDDSPGNLIPLLRLLRQLQQEPKATALRQQVLRLLVRQSGQSLVLVEKGTDAASLKQAYRPVFAWFEKEHPNLTTKLNDSGDEDPALWNKLLQSVDWSKGDAGRGEALFRARACFTCHAGNRALGPDLSGATRRFSREDLFTAIIYPSRDVAPAYRTSTVELRNGQLVHGIIAFESADGLIVQTGATTTVRLATPDIVARFPSNRSLMPNGLLKDLKAADLADLYGFLQTSKETRAK